MISVVSGPSCVVAPLENTSTALELGAGTTVSLCATASPLWSVRVAPFSVAVTSPVMLAAVIWPGTDGRASDAGAAGVCARSSGDATKANKASQTESRRCMEESGKGAMASDGQSPNAGAKLARLRLRGQ